MTLRFQNRETDFLNCGEIVSTMRWRSSMQSLFCEPLGNSSHLSTLRVPVNSSRSGSFAAKSCGFPPGLCATCFRNELILYPFSFWFIVLFENHSNTKRLSQSAGVQTGSGLSRPQTEQNICLGINIMFRQASEQIICSKTKYLYTVCRLFRKRLESFRADLFQMACCCWY